MSSIVVLDKTKRTATEVQSDILRAIRAGASTKSKIRAICKNLSGSALNKHLAQIMQTGEVEINENGEYIATDLGAKLTAFKQKHAEKLRLIRRTPNEKACDRTKAKTDEQLGKSRKNLVPCGCKKWQNGDYSHIRCYYNYANVGCGAMLEAFKVVAMRAKYDGIRDHLLKLSVRIDEKHANARKLDKRFRHIAENQINYLRNHRYALQQMYGAKIREYEQAYADFEQIEQMLNGITPKTSKTCVIATTVGDIEIASC